MGATLECDLSTTFASFNLAMDDPLVKRVQDACERLGYPFCSEKGGGGSDANIMVLHGIKPLVVGVGMTKVHTGEEYITIEDLNRSAELIVDLMTH